MHTVGAFLVFLDDADERRRLLRLLTLAQDLVFLLQESVFFLGRLGHLADEVVDGRGGGGGRVLRALSLGTALFLGLRVKLQRLDRRLLHRRAGERHTCKTVTTPQQPLRPFLSLFWVQSCKSADTQG